MPLKLYLRLTCPSDDGGASIVEYAILLVLVAAALISAVGIFGGEVSDTFNHAVEEMDQLPG